MLRAALTFRSMKTKEQLFCIMPYTHINFKPLGQTTSCWRQHGSLGNHKVSSINSIIKGEPLSRIKKIFNEGTFPEACESCELLEKSGNESTRIRLNKIHQHLDFDSFAKDTSSSQISSIELRFGNTCNLCCRHCNSKFSSKWNRLISKAPHLSQFIRLKLGEDGLREIYSDNNLDPEGIPDHLLDEIVENYISSITHIMIAGGEPLINDRHFNFLERIKDHGKKISLDYSSNLTRLGTNNHSVLKHWKNFKQIDLRVSLDGDPSMYNYARPGESLKKIEENIETLNESFAKGHLDIYATCTLSSYNITRLPQIIDYFISLGIFFHHSFVQYPYFLNLQLLPKELKNKISNELIQYEKNIDSSPIWNSHKAWNDQEKKMKNQFEIKRRIHDILKFIDTSLPQGHFSDFVEFNKIIDSQTEGVSFRDCYPEYQPYI